MSYKYVYEIIRRVATGTFERFRSRISVIDIDRDLGQKPQKWVSSDRPGLISRSFLNQNSLRT